jgi:hypothetical protein
MVTRVTDPRDNRRQFRHFEFRAIICETSTVGMGVLRNGLGRTHNEAAMLHTFGADEPIRQFLHISRLAPKYHYFEAIFVIEMRMQGGNDN